MFSLLYKSIIQYRNYIFLFIYHIVFSYMACFYAGKNGGDSVTYWFLNEDLSTYSWFLLFTPGTNIVKLITFPLVNYLHLPFWSGFLFFSAISGFAFLRWWGLLRKIVGGRPLLTNISYLLMFLPNLHFWTSLPGKEALIFSALVFMTEALYEGKFFSRKLWISMLFIGLIRPHVAALIIVAFAGAVLWKGQLPRKMRIILIFGAGAAMVIFTLVLKQITNAYDGLWNKTIRLYEAHIRVLKHTDAYVPLDQYTLPQKIFTVFFRPLPFEKSGLYYAAVSVDNLIFLLVSCVAVYTGIVSRKSLQNMVFISFCLIFALFFSVMYGYAYANYGLILRTKIMILPLLLTLYISVFAASFKVDPSL